MIPVKYPVLDGIDPGVAYFARARFRNNVLCLVGLHPILDIEASWWEGIYLAIEKPQVYKGGKARKSDIADLLYSAGWIAAHYRAALTTRYLPREWKGQVPKRIHHKRILQHLDAEEKMLLCNLTAADRGHIIDAIGIGLVHLGRMRKP